MTTQGPAESEAPKIFGMTRELFLSQLERAALVTQTQPVTGAVIRHLAAELKKGEPRWWPWVQKAWQKRRFVAWTEAWGLFLTAIHFEALNDAENPLVRYFPSCGGTAEADPAPALARFLADPPETFFERLRAGHRRTYVAARAPLWMISSLFFFQRRRMPYYLAEVNAGAGLNLAADAVAPQKGFDPDLVAARIGLDPEPLLLSDIAQRRWLTAALTPDNRTAIQEMDRAADILLDRVSRDPSFVQLVPAAAALGPRFIAKNIPAEEDAGLLVLNMGTTVRMSDEEYADYRSGMAETLAPWGDRALWVEIENVRGETYSTTFQFRIHRVQAGVLLQHVAMSLDFGAAQVSHNFEETAKFLG